MRAKVVLDALDGVLGLCCNGDVIDKNRNDDAHPISKIDPDTVELEFILDLSEFIRGSNALHKSKPFVFPVHLLPIGLSIFPDATVILSRFFVFFSSLINHCTLWDLNPGPFLFLSLIFALVAVATVQFT